MRATLTFLIMFQAALSLGATYAELQQKGTELYKEGKIAESLQAYEEAYALQPDPKLGDFITRLKNYMAQKGLSPIGVAATTPVATEAVVQAAPLAKVEATPEAVQTRAPSRKKSLGLTLLCSLFPGGGHYYLGISGKGIFYTLATGGLMAGSLVIKGQSDDFYSQYEAGSDPVQLEETYRLYDNAREKANYFLLAATGLYALSGYDAYAEHRALSLRWELAGRGSPRLVAKAEF